ncbi:MAG TPA: VOC family protein [Stellaceae bacterium]|nr:VOC family protein [Stellaceae bacterium]
MWMKLRNELIALGFSAGAWLVRVRRRLSQLGQPHLGALEHITIPVRDLALARRFYCDILGGAYFMTVDDETFRRFGRPPAEDGGEGAHHVSIYMSGATRLDLFLQRSGQPSVLQGHPHFAFRVSPKDMLRWKRVLDAAAIPSDGPIQLGPPGQASVYFNDPFGNHLEITCLGFCLEIPVRPPAMAALEWQPGLLV